MENNLLKHFQVPIEFNNGKICNLIINTCLNNTF